MYYNCVVFVAREPKQYTFNNVFTLVNVIVSYILTPALYDLSKKNVQHV